MQILYEKLMLTDNYQVSSVKEYLDNFIDEIINLIPGKTNITIAKQIEDFPLDSKKMFPVGIIVNELITNISKYAFPERETGEIEITVKEKSGKVTLTISDNGIGLSENFDLNNQSGFELMLVKMLSEQLDGEFTIENSNGTMSTLEFSIDYI